MYNDFRKRKIRYHFVVDEWLCACAVLTIPKFLVKLKTLLNPGGQISDSSDIIYMFDDDADGGSGSSDNTYYGEVFNIAYKGEKEKTLTGCILITTRSKMRLSPMPKSEIDS
jgi:hypothetical protein